jgi:hypothetical protein
MTTPAELKRLIARQRQRLQLLKEQQALYGASVDPHVLIEIEEIEARVGQLEAELARRGDEVESPAEAGVDEPTPPETTAMAGNSGIVMMGGSLQAEQLAVGANARAIKTVYTAPAGGTGAGLEAALARWLKEVEAKIEALADFEAEEKVELKQQAARIQAEAAKGAAANPARLERQLNALAAMLPELVAVTMAALQNPLAGVGLALERIDDRVRVTR